MGLNPNGTVATLSDLADEIGIAESFKLPLPDNRNFKSTDSLKTSVFESNTAVFPSKTIPGGERTVTTFNFENGTIEFIQDEDSILTIEQGLSFTDVASVLNQLFDSGINEVEIVELNEELNKKIRRGLLDSGFNISNNTVTKPRIITVTSEDIARDLVGTIKKVLNNNSNVVNFLTTNEEKRMFLRMLKKHAKTKRSGRAKEAALKNAVFYGIQRVVLDPISQINLHVPIAMAEPQKAARNSPLAAEESIMCIDDPYTIFKMQQANMSGKGVVGIAATSLKTFFASTTYYNFKLLEIRDSLKDLVSGDETAGQRIYDTLLDVCFDANFKKSELRALSNLYWEPLLNFVKKYDISNIEIQTKSTLTAKLLNSEKYIEIVVDEYGQTREYLKLDVVLDHLNKTSKYNNCADDISALVSAATDNAKELILSKINATEEFADIYTYLLSTGETFSDIAKFMTSPQMGVVRKYLAKSILEPNENYRNLKNAIDFVLNVDTLNPINKTTFNTIIIDFINDPTNSVIKKYIYSRIDDIRDITNDKLISRFYTSFQDNPQIENIEFRTIFINYLEKKYSEADEYTYVRINDSDEVGANDDGELQMNDEENEYSKPVYNTKELFKEDWANIYTYVRYTLTPKCEELERIPINEFELIMLRDRIIPGCEEQKHLGSLLSINKGVKTDDYEEYNYIKSFETWINQRCVDAKLNTIPFDFLRFAEDSEYQKEWIEKYEKLKINKNILAIIVTLPHFNEMLKLVKVNRALIEKAAVFKIERDLEKKIMGKTKKPSKWSHAVIEPKHTKSLSKKEFQVLRQLVSEAIPLNWILGADISMKVPIGQKWYDSTSTPRLLDKTARILKFSNVKELATFVRMMNHYIIPALIEQYSENKFLKNLKQNIYAESVSGNPVYTWIPTIDMNESDISTELTYQEMVEGFDELDKIDVGQKLNISAEGEPWTISDLFFLYDLIVNKSKIGKHSFVRFFANQIKLGKRYTLNNSYYDYLLKLDSGEEKLDIDIVDFFMSAGYLPATQSKFDVKFTKKDLDKKTKIEWNGYSVVPQNISPDFTFRNMLYTSQHVHKSVPKRKGFESGINRIVQVMPNSSDVKNEIINYFNTAFGKTKVPVKMVDSKEIESMFNDETLKGDLNSFLDAEGFIYNGVTYINADKCEVSTPFHELLHVVCAAMKYHKTYRGKYYQWLDAIKEHPKYQEMLDAVRKKNTINGIEMKHGSDLKEEVLVEFIADIYAQSFEDQWGDSKKISIREIQNNVVNILNEMFETDITTDIDSTKLGHTTLGDILLAFNSRLLKPGNSLFSETRVPMNQMLSTIKRIMINKGIIEYDGKCY